MIYVWVAPAAISVALLVLAYLVWWLDRFRWEHLPHYLAGAALGAAAGVLVPGFAPLSALAGPQAFITAAGKGTSWVAHVGDSARAALIVAVVLAGVLLALERRAGVETPVDGVIFGIAAGCGFAFANGVTGWLVERATASGMLVGAILAWSALGGLLGVGARWSLAAVRGGRVLLRIGWVLLEACVLAAILGGVSRVLPSVWAAIALGVAALGCVVAVAVWDEHRVVARQLREESDLGVVPEELVATVASYRRRIRHAWWPHPEERRAILQLLLALAFRKEQLIGLVPAHAQLYGLEVGRLRQRLRRVFRHEEGVI